VSSDSRRGLPKPGATQKGGKPAVRTQRKPGGKRRGLIRRLVRRVVLLLVAWIGIVCIWSAGFIGVKCYSSAPSSRAAAVVPPANLPRYTRAEAFTYLALPEWFIVDSADEYASFIAARRPSGFPHVGSIRQYWSLYGTACAATRRTYPFERGYHIMLGVIGASFTVESSLRSVYEHTIGWLTERLSSTDTAEDEFARRTARDYGAFMHRTPWYEFPFASRLASLWRDVPLTGPHPLRKVERRMALSTEYAIKTAYGFVIRQASGAAYDAEDLRIYARVADATPAMLADPKVKIVQPLGPQRFVVSLPRYQDFTATALALTAKGVRFTDIAGNDVIVVTALARRGISTGFTAVEVLATPPILTDPTMQRLVLRVKVEALREAVLQLTRAGAVVEHFNDY
jgi:hypothetical protein